MSVQLLRHARWHRSGFASCCWSKRVDLPFCLSLSISLAVDTGRSQFDDNTFRVRCRQALLWAPASRSLSCLWSLFGRPSGTGFHESRSAKRPLTSTLGECMIGGVPPRKRQNEEKNAWYLGKTRWWEKTYSCSWARLRNEGRIAGLRLLYSRSRKPSRAIAMLGFLPGRRRDWSDLVRPRWDRRHFSAAKNRQKNHWIAWCRNSFLFDEWSHLFQPEDDINEIWTRWKQHFFSKLNLSFPAFSGQVRTDQSNRYGSTDPSVN